MTSSIVVESMPRRPVTAIALDGGIDFKSAPAQLIWPEVRSYAYGRVFSSESGRLYVFGFGAVVHEGATLISRAIIEEMEKIFGRKVLPETMETYYVVVDAQRTTGAPRVGWDQVTIPEESQELLGAIALLLGQSVALERYERAADLLIDEAWQMSGHLVARGRPPLATRATLQRIGRLTRTRLELTNLFYLIDRPEETWEDQKVEVLYDALFSNLELGQRHNALVQKFDTVESATEQVIGIWSGLISNRLEWAIVILIVVELLLAALDKI